MITQGKWEFLEEDFTIRTKDFSSFAGMGDYRGVIICQLDAENWRVNNLESIAEKTANARLIAAAPELLAACKDGEKFLDCLLAGNGMSETQLKMLSENRMAFRRILDEAIAKAEQT